MMWQLSYVRGWGLGFFLLPSSIVLSSLFRGRNEMKDSVLCRYWGVFFLARGKNVTLRNDACKLQPGKRDSIHIYAHSLSNHSRRKGV
ncbi:hypothetical protein M378DRAFT_166499 [Amanita muscaria Koide BX008]|uniref:Uncharacterized protein n=1 Tax=Amanita muscaria (strain Koide BX008) TaxID=946122 RepID=A0A0C2WZ89_AMAMK|nr:hypothetical protein M378DRAFT_166499 [Amanita muscaria Koide BX008]